MLQNTLPITGQLPQQCIFDPKCQYAKVNQFCKHGSASDIILANPLLLRRKRWSKKDNRQRYRNECISYSWIHIQKLTRAKSMTNHGKGCPTREKLQSQSRLITTGLPPQCCCSSVCTSSWQQWDGSAVLVYKIIKLIWRPHYQLGWKFKSTIYFCLKAYLALLSNITTQDDSKHKKIEALHGCPRLVK